MGVDIIGVAVLAVMTGLVCVILKQHRPEFAMAVGLCFSTVTLLYLLSRLSPVLALFEQLSGTSGLPEDFFGAVIKGLGIGIIVNFAADSCNDAGQTSLASKVELAGKLAILYLCLPMINEILKIIRNLVG